MNTTKKLMTLLLALMTTITALAYDFEVNGIYYLFNGSEATVTSATPYYIHSDKYTGDVYIPNTVTYQGVTYPVTAIGNDAFYWSEELTSIRIPKSIKRVEGSMCFYSCNSLSVVEIESLESWCNIDFEISPGYNFSYSNPLSYAHDLYINGEKLTELVIPSGVTKIGTSAFCHLSYISRLEIPASVTSIGHEAFCSCEGFDRLDIPDLVSWMTIDILGRDSNPMGYARKVYLDGIEMPHELVIPRTITKISPNAFNGCDVITSVNIPSTVKTIGADAFLKCDSLERVEIQDITAWCGIDFENVSSNPISNGIPEAWYDQQKVAVYINGNPVTQLDIPEEVTAIGAYAFAGAPFEHVTFPNTLVSIGNYAFRHNNIIDEVVLPESLKSLGKGVFYDCYYLKKAQINTELEVIPDSVFALCQNLSDISLPLTVRKIGQAAFVGCKALTTMPMTDSLQVIDEYAFLNSGIKYLKTGKSLTSIGDAAFSSCTYLTRVEISDPVTTLGQHAFSYLSSLQSIIVGNGVHRIPEYFCAGCYHLKSVTLGHAVDTLDTKCFDNCIDITTIICKAEVPPMMNGDEDSFFKSVVFQNATLYVPGSSLEAYKTAKVWEKFQNIVCFDNVDIPGDVNGDGEISVADVNSLIDIVVMGGNGAHTRIPAADVNGDSEINIADVNAIIDIILSFNNAYLNN